MEFLPLAIAGLVPVVAGNYIIPLKYLNLKRNSDSQQLIISTDINAYRYLHLTRPAADLIPKWHL